VKTGVAYIHMCDFKPGEPMVRREPDIPVGTRFKLSKLGEARNPRLEKGAEGTIVGGSRYKSSLRVVIDGRKTPLSMHRDYIEPITPNAV